MGRSIVAAVTLLLAVGGCDRCVFETDPFERTRLGCPPQLSAQRRICEHLVDCGRFEESEIDVCVENHRTFTEDAAGCLRCVERTSCDEISSQCEDAC